MNRINDLQHDAKDDQCGRADVLSLDHIVRYRDGGQDTLENLRVLCLPGNRRRG